MFIAYVVVAVLLAATLVASAIGKLTRSERQLQTLTLVGVPPRAIPLLAVCELAGAVGLLAGIVVTPLGIAAAVGVIAYFVGAVVAHLRVGDAKGVATPLPLLVAGAAALTLGIGAM